MFETPQSVLVTGAVGFVGSRLVEALSAHGHRVRAVDLRPESDLSRLRGVDYRQVDLRDRRASREAVEGVTRVVHLAAVRTKEAGHSPRASLEVNVDATYDLFEAAADAGVGRIVFGSSHTVYGAFQDRAAGPYAESDTGVTGRGLNMYAATKLAAEAFLEAMRSAGGCDYLSCGWGRSTVLASAWGPTLRSCWTSCDPSTPAPAPGSRGLATPGTA